MNLTSFVCIILFVYIRMHTRTHISTHTCTDDSRKRYISNFEPYKWQNRRLLLSRILSSCFLFYDTKYGRQSTRILSCVVNVKRCLDSFASYILTECRSTCLKESLYTLYNRKTMKNGHWWFHNFPRLEGNH